MSDDFARGLNCNGDFNEVNAAWLFSITPRRLVPHLGARFDLLKRHPQRASAASSSLQPKHKEECWSMRRRRDVSFYKC